MCKRDPRIDPQQGDALLPVAGHLWRYVVRRESDRVLVHGGRSRTWMNLPTWRAWAAQPMESVTYNTPPPKNRS